MKVLFSKSLRHIRAELVQNNVQNIFALRVFHGVMIGVKHASERCHKGSSLNLPAVHHRTDLSVPP